MNFLKHLIAILLLIIVSSCSTLDSPVLETPTPAPTQTLIQTPISQPAEHVGISKKNLLILSCSSGWWLGKRIAPLIEAELGVRVNIVDKSIANLSAVQVIEALNGNKTFIPLRDISDELRNADIIILNPSPAHSRPKENANNWLCIPPSDHHYVDDCPDDFAAYISDLKIIIDRIFELRGEQPTIIRFFSYWGRPNWWEKSDVVDECMSCVEELHNAIQKAIEEYNIPLAPVLDVFNGSEHDLDPADMDYIRDDDVHLNGAGAQLLAETIFKLGFDYSYPVNDNNGE